MTAHDTPTVGGRSEWIDRCAREESCGSWYDRGEYAAIDPKLAESAIRDALLASVRVERDPAALLTPCPRCTTAAQATDAVLVPVRFVGVTLSMCPTCAGVWAPTGAVDALIKSLSLYDAAAGAPNQWNYRSAAAAPVMRDNGALRTQCCECKQTVPFDQSVIDVDGLLCVVCASARDRGEAPSQLADGGVWGFIRSVLRDLGLS